ncbi:MAG: hypothetical protein K0R92_237 [Lachnospiraceae bacterium]|jgi:hypothetical protein|nr:hypothetical protein [Lachnospiraceae bacterium]
MKQYEAPKMMFEELTFFEKIADICWGGINFLLDNPYTSNEENYQIQLLDKAKCGREDSEGLLTQAAGYLGSDYNKWYTDYVQKNHSRNLSNVRLEGVTLVNS